MPVILDPADHGRWLDPALPDGASPLRPCPAGWPEAYRVDPRAGSYRNDDERLIEPIEGGPLADDPV